MNVRNEIYSMIAKCGLLDSIEADEASEQLSQADSKLLIHDIDMFYNKWIEYDHLLKEKRTKELLHQKHVQESSFEIACVALALKGDPSVIPYFLKYVPLDDWNWKVEANMEDYNEQNLERCIVGAEYYGEAYIPVLLAHIHQLVPDKMLWAGSFFYDTLYHDLNIFEDHPLMRNLHLAKRESFLELMDYCLKQTLETFEEDHPDQLEEILRIIASPIDSISSETEGVVQIAYIKQEFLKLHAAD